MRIDTEGLVIREKSVGESDRLVTVLTRRQGILRAFARQANSIRNGKLSATQLFSYSRFTVFMGRDTYMIDDAQPIQLFFDLRKDIARLSLAQYFCELAGALAPQGEDAEEFLRLMLNALHFLSKGSRPEPLLKATVEMRMLSLAGYMPDLVCCADCGCYEADVMYFFPRGGLIRCGNCCSPDGSVPCVALGRGALTGLRHIVYSEFEKLFSFSLSPEGMRELSEAGEQYILCTLERGFNTLDFYHETAGVSGGKE